MKLPPARSRTHATADAARALRTLRAWRNTSQRDLSKVSGFSYGAISKWERGHAGITTPNRAILAEALRIPLEVFDALATHGDPLVVAMSGYHEMPVAHSLYNYQQAARRVGACVNTIRKAVLQGIVTPRREFRSVWFTNEDLDTIRRWQRERAVDLRSRLAGLQASQRRRMAA